MIKKHFTSDLARHFRSHDFRHSTQASQHVPQDFGILHYYTSFAAMRHEQFSHSRVMRIGENRAERETRLMANALLLLSSTQ